jgi:peptidoglycan hydrolase-like protein with peptidoglycan-binding domain
VSFLGSVGQGSVALFRHRGIAATAGAAVLVLIAGGTFAAVSSQRVSHDSLANASNSRQLTGTSNEPGKVVGPPAAPLRVVSVTPASGTHGVNGGAPVRVTFSSALAPNSPLPTLSPKISGSWQVAGDAATFTPSYGFLPRTNVTVRIPGGNGGVQGAATAAGTLKTSQSVSFTTGSFSTLRMQQVLAQLGYLPLDWAADGSTASPAVPAGEPTVPAGDLNAQVSAAYAPPSGTFSFQPGYPGELSDQWRTGSDNMLDQGAIRAFQYNQGLTMDGVAGPQFWSYLLKAAAHDQRNPNGYSYALATQGSSNESLQVWHNGNRILNTPANTGIPQSPTADGTFPVYERLQFQIMKGTNPDGSKYADPVSWIAYFNGGDAVHGFYRYSYGWYQSLGCVELPPTTAQYVWPYLTYGTLVTVQGPVA